MSADGVIFNNVYDNGYSNNQVIFSLRDDLKNGTMTHKPTGKTVIPTENNPYPKIGTATMVDGIFEPTELQGYLQGENGMYPVFTQTKVGPIKKMSVLDEDV